MDEAQIAARDEFIARLRQVTPRIWVTYSLIAANVIVFVAMVATGVDIMKPTLPDLLAWGASFAPRTTSGEQWRLGTSMFLHFGVIHLAIDMVGLFVIGRYVERMVGNLGFLAAYLVAGLAGSVLSMAWHPNVVSAGASGGIFGIYGVLLAFLVRHSRTLPQSLGDQHFSSGVVFVLANILHAQLTGNTDIQAPLGGLVSGFLAGLVVVTPLDATIVARTRRAVAAGVLGLTLLGGAALAVPGPDDFKAEVQRMSAIEQTLNQAYGAALDQLKAGTLSPEDFATRVKTELLPPWQEEIGRLEAVRISDHPALVRDKLVAFMRVREDELSLEAEANADPANRDALMEQERVKTARRIKMTEELKALTHPQ